ncbi:MAG: hypothetical protein U5N27_04370 [Rhizobium sp.]|nr:hypothetical protein [Rhizobium sp.]
MADLASRRQDVVENGPPDRRGRWHANELLAEIVEDSKVDMDKVNKYILDIALKKSGYLESFGRMVWRRSGGEQYDLAARIDIKQAIVAVLFAADGPLEANEIRSRVREIRGLDKPFQIQISDPVLRFRA